jgi:hypothetical protein
MLLDAEEWSSPGYAVHGKVRKIPLSHHGAVPADRTATAGSGQERGWRMIRVGGAATEAEKGESMSLAGRAALVTGGGRGIGGASLSPSPAASWDSRWLGDGGHRGFIDWRCAW